MKLIKTEKEVTKLLVKAGKYVLLKKSKSLICKTEVHTILWELSLNNFADIYLFQDYVVYQNYFGNIQIINTENGEIINNPFRNTCTFVNIYLKQNDKYFFVSDTIDAETKKYLCDFKNGNIQIVAIDSIFGYYSVGKKNGAKLLRKY